MTRINHSDTGFEKEMSLALFEAMKQAGNRPVVIVCVGTDRSTGDAFGPLLGTKLQGLKGVDVYGTLNEPVHAVSLVSTLETIDRTYTNPFIIAVDACLGNAEHIGHVLLQNKPLRPGAGVKKALPAFGDYSLTAVVNVSGFMEYFVLQNTRLSVVMKMVDKTAVAIKSATSKYRTRKIRMRILSIGEVAVTEL